MDTLTIYYDYGHAFVKLDCHKCSIHGSIQLYVGKYSVPYNNEDEKSFSVTDFFMLIKYPIFNLISEGIGIEGKNIKPIKQSSVGNSLFPVAYFFDTDYGYHLNIESKSSYIDYFNNTYLNRPEENLNNLFQKTFNVSEEKMQKTFDWVHGLLSYQCNSSLSYKALGNNCVDFTKDIYQMLGLEGNKYYQILYPDAYPISRVGVYMLYSDLYDSVSSFFTSPTADSPTSNLSNG